MDSKKIVYSDESQDGQVELSAKNNFTCNTFYLTIDILAVELKIKRKAHKIFWNLLIFLPNYVTLK